MPSAQPSPPSVTTIGRAAASLASNSRGGVRGSVTGAMSTCSGHDSGHPDFDFVVPHFAQRTMSLATRVRPSEAHMRAEPAASASSCASGPTPPSPSSASGFSAIANPPATSACVSLLPVEVTCLGSV